MSRLARPPAAGAPRLGAVGAGGPPGGGLSAAQALAFAPDASALAFVDPDGRAVLVHVWKNRFAVLPAPAAGPAGRAVALAFQPALEGPPGAPDVFVAFADRSVGAFVSATRRRVGALAGHRSPVRSLALDAGGEVLATASLDSVRLWGARDLAPRRVLRSGPSGAVFAALCRGGSLLTAFADGCTWTWDASGTACAGKLYPPSVAGDQGGAARVHLSAFAADSDGRWLAGVGPHPLIVLWSVPAGRVQAAIAGPAARNVAVQWVEAGGSRGQPVLAVLGGDGVLRWVDPRTRTVEFEVKSDAGGGRLPPRSPFWAFTVDAQGNYAAGVDGKGDVWLFDVDRARDAGKGSQLQRLRAVEVQQRGARQQPGDVLLAGESLDVPAEAVHAAPPKWKRSADRSSPVAAQPRRARAATEGGADGAERLKALLLEHGEYPARYRVMIWRKLLQTPRNEGAYAVLEAKGMHPGFVDVANEYPIQDETLLRRLAVLWSGLSYWSPLFASVPYLPAFAFPFAKVCGGNRSDCFEIVATILSNWADTWFEMYPNPPLSTLSAVENVLAYHDKPLADALREKGGVQTHAWTLLQGALTEVLSSGEWLKLWDHILSNDASYIYYATVAFMVYFRASIIAAEKEEELQMFFRRSSALDIGTVIRLAYSLQASTPPALMVPTQPFQPLQADRTYAFFKNGPQGETDTQLEQQDRLRAEEEALMRRRQIVEDIELQTAALKSAQRQDGERAAAAEAAGQGAPAGGGLDGRQQLQAMEEALRVQSEQVDDEIREAKLKHIQEMQRAYAQQQQQQREAHQKEKERLKGEIRERAEAMQREIQRKLEDEKIRSMESQAQRQLWSMQEEAEHAARTERLRQGIQNRVAEIEHARVSSLAKWKMEEEEEELKRAYEKAKRDRFAKLEEELATQLEAESVVIEQQARSEAELLKLNHERNLQRISEQMTNLTAEELQAQKQRAAIAAESTSAAVHKAMQAQRETFMQKQVDRGEMVAQAQELLSQKEQDRASEMIELRQKRWWAEQEAKLMEFRGQLELRDIREKQRMGEMLTKLEDQHRADQELYNDMVLHERWLKQKAEDAVLAGSVKDQASKEEKAEFEKLRRVLDEQHKTAQEDVTRQHREIMQELMVQREKQLMELEQAHRKQVAKEEVGAVGAEEELRQGLRQKLKERLADEEEALLLDTERAIAEAGAGPAAPGRAPPPAPRAGGAGGGGGGGRGEPGALPDSPLTADLLSDSPPLSDPDAGLETPSTAGGAALRAGASLTAVPGLGAADSPLSADSSDIVSSAQKEARDLIERHEQSRSSTAGSSLGGGGPAGDDEASSALDSALDPL